MCKTMLERPCIGDPAPADLSLPAVSSAASDLKVEMSRTLQSSQEQLVNTYTHTEFDWL